MIKLFKYQEEGVDFLVNGSKQKLLLDEMGLGKTPQLIMAAVKIKAQRILVVVPAIGKYHWAYEFKKFAGLKAYVAENGETHHDKDIIIASYEYAKKFSHLYNKTPLDILIADECHFLKNPESGRAKGILGNRGLIHNAKRTWLASGTPAPNNASEIWVYLYTFGLTQLSYQGFIARYCNSHISGGRYGRVQISGTNTKYSHELKAMLKQCSLRRLKKDVLDLPSITHNTFIIEGDTDSNLLKTFPDLKEKIKEELSTLQEKLDFHAEVSDEKLLSVLSLMSQSIASLRRYHGLKKTKACAELVNEELEAQEYEKIIIFGIHSDVLQYLKRSINQKFKPLIITGATPALERQAIVNRFQTDKEAKVFIGNISAAGTTITLTAANQVMFIEQSWCPADNAQASDRAHRISQKNPVTVRHLAIKDSLDEKITATLTRKVREISTFI